MNMTHNCCSTRMNGDEYLDYSKYSNIYDLVLFKPMCDILFKKFK